MITKIFKSELKKEFLEAFINQISKDESLFLNKSNTSLTSEEKKKRKSELKLQIRELSFLIYLYLSKQYQLQPARNQERVTFSTSTFSPSFRNQRVNENQSIIPWNINSKRFAPLLVLLDLSITKKTEECRKKRNKLVDLRNEFMKVIKLNTKLNQELSNFHSLKQKKIETKISNSIFKPETQGNEYEEKVKMQIDVKEKNKDLIETVKRLNETLKEKKKKNLEFEYFFSQVSEEEDKIKNVLMQYRIKLVDEYDEIKKVKKKLHMIDKLLEERIGRLKEFENLDKNLKMSKKKEK